MFELKNQGKDLTRKVINYNGRPVKVGNTLQKVVTKYEKDHADVPEIIKNYLADKNIKETVNYHEFAYQNICAINSDITTSIIDKDNIIWVGTNEGMARINPAEKDKRDRIQYFMGARYFYDTNSRVEFILSDGNRGVWVLTETGVSHIEMKPMGYAEKAVLMSDYTQNHVSRRGLVSDSRLAGDKWIPRPADNDGLWTAMYAAGECFRYAAETDPQKKEEARKIATKSVEAVLLLANISSRDGQIDAKIRHFINDYNEMSKEYVRKGGDPTYFYPEEGPLGMDMSKLLNPADHRPRTPEDWVTEGEGETQKRTIKGFMARSYHLDGMASEPVPDGGFFFKKMMKDGKMIAKSRPFDPGTGPGDPARSRYYGVNHRATVVEDFAGVEVDASLEIPERLANLYRSIPKGDGTYYTDTDIIYKADTSTDEIVGHLFLYKVAFDTLCAGEDGDHELGQIIIDTTRNFAQHVLDNDYCLVDATGQPTLWGKMTRYYFNSIYTWEDCALNCLVLLSTFKLAAYLTGDDKWEQEYRKAALLEPYRYADLAGEYRERYNRLAVEMYKKKNPDSLPGDPRLDPDSRETAIAVQLQLNYSDEEMAMLAFYVLFQTETDPILIDKYRNAIDDWWISIQYGDNPLWFYIYQLAYPEVEEKADLKTAAWALKRHPIDTRSWFIDNSVRNDITIISYEHASRNRPMALKPGGWFTALPADERYIRKYNGSPFEVKGGSELGDILESSATYTLPYWLGRFHGMITE